MQQSLQKRGEILMPLVRRLVKLHMEVYTVLPPMGC